MHFKEESIFYFIPIGASLVLLFDCPNLLPTFGTDFRPLLPAIIITPQNLLETEISKRRSLIKS